MFSIGKMRPDRRNARRKPPSATTWTAAAWFGLLADSTPIRFPVTVGSIPTGNAIVIGASSAALHASLQIANGSGPTVAMRSNPSDPYSKILLITGDSDDDLLTAALAFVLQRDIFEGSQVRISSIKIPAQREPDDAPRWLSTEKITRIGDIAHAVSFIASEGAGFITGQRIVADGGRSLGS